MKGPEIVAALREIINSTSLNTLSTEDKVTVRSLLDIINLCLFTQALYLKIVYFSGQTSGGTLTVHPTTDGTATGTAVFSSIFHATATPWVPSGGALTLTPTCVGQSISSDFKTRPYGVFYTRDW